jgi:DNA-binding LacI/PurR family transcriptional regulator
MEEKQKKVTIYDVAKRASVTIATVSRVINGKDNVALDTKERVMKAIEELNYYPSPIASGLSSSRSQQIGVLVPFFFGEFFLKVLQNIVKELENYEVILYDASTPEMKKKLLAKMAGENKLDGLLMVSMPLLPDEEFMVRNVRFPIILLDNKHKEHHSVYFDNIIGSFNAVNYLIQLGHKRTAIITGASEEPFNTSVAKDRLQGYKMALSMAGIPVQDRYIEISDWSRDGAYKLATKLLQLKERPTAIFAVSDIQAVGVLEAAKDLGLRVPEDLSVLGYDNMDFADYIGLSTVDQPLSMLAQIGLRMLMEEIGRVSKKKESIVLLPALVSRNTTSETVEL